MIEPNPDWVKAPSVEHFWSRETGYVTIDSPEKRYKSYGDFCAGKYIPPFVTSEDTSDIIYDPCQP